MTIWLKKSGWIIGWLLALIPVGLWLISGEVKPGNTWSNLRILGQLCGILGISLFSVNFILAARFPWVEYCFSGLDKVYKAHHQWGAYAFIFMLLHPTFLALQYLGISAKAVIQFVVSGLTDFAVLWGELALGVVFIVLFVTFYVRTKYEHWKSLHQWVGLGAIFAAIHVYVIPSTTARYEPLRWYIIGLISTAILAWLYTTVFKKFGFKKHNYMVSKIAIVGQITQITMKPTHKVLLHKPGQFGFFSFVSSGIEKKQHPFSFTSTGTTGEISIAVKNLGDFTKQLQLLEAGIPVTIEGPYGEFGSGGKPDNIRIWIAGGIGITPYISMARNLKSTDPDTVLWVCVKKASEVVFWDELKQIENTLPNFTLHLVETDVSGYLTGAQILESLDVLHTDYYICGPKAMMEGLTKQLLELGITKKQVYSEQFALN
jgi:predicted ferric reductase